MPGLNFMSFQLLMHKFLEYFDPLFTLFRHQLVNLCTSQFIFLEQLIFRHAVYHTSLIEVLENAMILVCVSVMADERLFVLLCAI